MIIRVRHIVRSQSAVHTISSEDKSHQEAIQVQYCLNVLHRILRDSVCCQYRMAIYRYFTSVYVLVSLLKFIDDALEVGFFF